MTAPLRDRDFATRLVSALIHAGLSRASAELAVAQAALESGWGSSRVARLGLNFWNLTRSPSDHRPVIDGGDKEPDGLGGWHPITQRFRSYGSIPEAAADYVAFLKVNPRYAGSWRALNDVKVTDFALCLSAEGFYTAPVGGYRDNLLTDLDRVRAALTPVSKETT